MTTVDYENETLAEEIQAATNGDGVDVILDHRLDDYLELELTVAAQSNPRPNRSSRGVW